MSSRRLLENGSLRLLEATAFARLLEAAATGPRLDLSHFDPESTTALVLASDLFDIDPEQTTALVLTSDVFDLDPEQTYLIP